MSLKKRILAFNLGVVLGFVILGAVVVAGVLATGGSVNFTTGGGGVNVGSQTKAGGVVTEVRGDI